MSKAILDKIKYLCKEIPDVEWSGPLFYSVKGSIKEPSKMIITLQDILPMNKGTKAYTEYELDDRYMDYLMEDERRMDWKMGHIHSHNTMNVFFSRTDMSELEDNSVSHNIYLSLIVNNWMDFCAKVAFRVTASTRIVTPYMALDENGTAYKIADGTLDMKKEKLFIHDCVIQAPNHLLKVGEDFAQKVAGIIEDAKPKIKPTIPYTQVSTYKVSGPSMTSQMIIPVKQKASTVAKEYLQGVPWAELEGMLLERTDELTLIEDFIISLLRGTNPADNEVTNIEEALEELVSLTEDVDDDSIAQNILSNYVVLFDKYFQDEEEEAFIEISESVIEVLEEHELVFPFLSKTIMAIKYMILKFETNDNRTTV